MCTVKKTAGRGCDPNWCAGRTCHATCLGFCQYGGQWSLAPATRSASPYVAVKVQRAIAQKHRSQSLGDTIRIRRHLGPPPSAKHPPWVPIASRLGFGTGKDRRTFMRRGERADHDCWGEVRAPTRRATDFALGYTNEPKPVIRRCGYYRASTRSVIATPATGSHKACSMLGTSSRRSANRFVRAWSTRTAMVNADKCC